MYSDHKGKSFEKPNRRIGKNSMALPKTLKVNTPRKRLSNGIALPS